LESLRQFKSKKRKKELITAKRKTSGGRHLKFRLWQSVRNHSKFTYNTVPGKRIWEEQKELKQKHNLEGKKKS